MYEAEIPLYFVNSLRVIVTFVAVSLTLFICLRFARRFNLVSTDVLQALGPALPFSLLVASVIWSLFATIEITLMEGMPAWMIMRGISVMLMVALFVSPITILIGIPVCVIYFFFGKKIPASVIHLYVVVVMTMECVWYAKVINQV